MHTTHKIHSHPSKNKFLSIFRLNLNVFDANQPRLEAKSIIIGVDSPLSLYFLLLHFFTVAVPAASAADTAATANHGPPPVVCRLVMYRTKVLMYRTMVLLARLTKVRR
jgi:hypothetical protein